MSNEVFGQNMKKGRKKDRHLFIVIIGIVVLVVIVLPILEFTISLVWRGFDRGVSLDSSEEESTGYLGNFNPVGSESVYESRDYNCKDFKTHAEAQKFFEAAGPGDRHKLDRDGNGLACEGLP